MAPPTATSRSRGSSPATIEDFYRVVCSLNDEFGLRLHIPDPNVSPSKRRQQSRSEEQARVDEIIHRSQRLYFQDHFRFTDHIKQFRLQAQNLFKQWVIKPNGDPDTTPTGRSSTPHGARNARERAALQTALLEVLQDVTSSIISRPKWPKRPSNEFPDPSTKRCRSTSIHCQGGLDGQGPEEEIDDIPVRSRAANQSEVSRPPTSLTNHSANTSRTSFVQSVFSAPASDYDGTQTTIAFSQSQKERGTQESYPACSAEYEALNESFSNYEEKLVHAPGEEPQLPDPRSTLYPQDRTKDAHLLEPHLGSDGDLYSSFPDEPDLHAQLTDVPAAIDKRLLKLHNCLRSFWPKFPIPQMNDAPIIITWELTRAANHCGVNLSNWDVPYEPGDVWHDQTKFRGQIACHPLFVGKGLPQACGSTAWIAGLDSFQAHGRAVVLSAELVFNSQSSDRLFSLEMLPPRLELGHRLGRRFGPDRFLELLVPSLTSQDVPEEIKNDDKGVEVILDWLCGNHHYFVGRTWSALFNSAVKNSSRKGANSASMHDNKKKPHLTRVHMFAVDGNSFRAPQVLAQIPAQEDARKLERRMKLRMCDLLTWALSIRTNASQPLHKLFSRLAISLSKTQSTLTLERNQIHNRAKDLGSHKVMNDGIGRMSRSFARKVAEHLGLDDVPCAYQGRLGSAKGMWIIDTNDDGLDENFWIETYPSQRKWECDFQDVHHRTFEVKDWPKELRTGYLNQQLIPILEAQANDKGLMRQAIADHLRDGLRADIEGQSVAMNHPMDFRAWMHRSGFTSGQRMYDDYVPFLGGLPDRDEDAICLLLDAGFEPNRNTFLKDLVWKMREKQANLLKSKVNVKVPRSTIAFMVIDFTGILEEGEVHLGFSNKFQTDGESEIILDDVDVLVARNPAHFASDIQKVKAVFKPSLKRLKDVIVFSSKGQTPLADLLSGGDYDGDRAWICWDTKIVQNFSNSKLPDMPDLVQQGYLRKDGTAFESVLQQSPNLDSACNVFMRRAFSFSMQQNMLGICTKFKEKLCYLENSVASPNAVVLSTLVGLLVDQAKQGYVFTWDDFTRLKSDYMMKYKELEYENDRSSRNRYVRPNREIHVLDYLKFEVAIATIEDALEAFSKFLNDPGTNHWDEDLKHLYNEFEELAKTSRSVKQTMTQLRRDIDTLSEAWRRTMLPKASDSVESDYQRKVKDLHQRWLDIKPPEKLMGSKMISNLLDPWNGDPGLSKWSLLKASTMFRLYYNKLPNVVWKLAGRQLVWMKAMASCRGGEGGAIAVTAEMWTILKPDNKRVMSRAAWRAVGQDTESAAAVEEVMEFDDYGMEVDDA